MQMAVLLVNGRSAGRAVLLKVAHILHSVMKEDEETQPQPSIHSQQLKPLTLPVNESPLLALLMLVIR